MLPPFDSLVNDVLALDTPTPKLLNKIARLYIHKDDYELLITLESDPKLALTSYKRLVDASVRDEIARKLDYAEDIDSTLLEVEELLKNRHVFIPEQRAKMWEELTDREDDVMMEFMKYNISRGKLSLAVAFSGIGKTVTSLCFANAATQQGYNVLIIALKDWSESELKRKTQPLINKENIAFAVYGDCTLSDIDYEIRVVQPDIVIVDALTDIDMPVTEKFHRTIGDIAASLRAMAVTYDCHVFTTHQTNALEPLVLPHHLRDSKSNLLQSVDIGWGIGAKSVADSQKIINTVKIRHQESVRPWKFVFDYNSLEILDKGAYDERGTFFKN